MQNDQLPNCNYQPKAKYKYSCARRHGEECRRKKKANDHYVVTANQPANCFYF